MTVVGGLTSPATSFRLYSAAAPSGAIRPGHAGLGRPNEHSPPGPVLMRVDANGSTGDPVADEARSNVLAVTQHMAGSLGRTSIDGRGGTFGVVVHAVDSGNASWSKRDNQIELGNGDGEQFGSFAQSRSVIAHELYHGVVDSEVALDYNVPEQAAIHESLADVYAASVTGSWKVAADVYTPQIAGDALRDLEYPTLTHARDSPSARGASHLLSGIPSLAAVRSAAKLGIEGVSRVWYQALVNHLPDGAQFSDLALATISAASKTYGEQSLESAAVRDAWKSVGILTN